MSSLRNISGCQGFSPKTSRTQTTLHCTKHDCPNSRRAACCPTRTTKNSCNLSLSLSRYMFVRSLSTVSIEQRLVICDSSLDWLIPSWFSFIYCFGMLILPGFVFLGIIINQLIQKMIWKDFMVGVRFFLGYILRFSCYGVEFLINISNGSMNAKHIYTQ